jgi:hypothetical protein
MILAIAEDTPFTIVCKVLVEVTIVLLLIVLRVVLVDTPLILDVIVFEFVDVATDNVLSVITVVVAMIPFTVLVSTLPVTLCVNELMMFVTVDAIPLIITCKRLSDDDATFVFMILEVEVTPLTVNDNVLPILSNVLVVAGSNPDIDVVDTTPLTLDVTTPPE